jgi:hypothetical protein
MVIGNNVEETGQATIRQVAAYPLGGPDEGTVYIYEFIPHPIEFVMNIESFYLATFFNDVFEIAWGVGRDPKEALEEAARRWQKYGDENDENPFKKVLSEMTQGDPAQD